MFKREAEQFHHDQRRDQRYRNRDGRNDRGPPALQENEHHEDDEDERFAERQQHVVHRRRDEARRVVVHRVFDALGKALRQFLHLDFDALLQLQRVRSGTLKHGHHDARLVAEEGGRRILQRPEFDPRDIAQAHDRSVHGVGAHHDVAEFVRVGEAADGVHLHFERRAFRRRRLADLAGGDLDVLLRNGVLHVDGGDAEIGEPVGIEPNSHRIAPLAENLNVADSGEAFQRVDHLQIGVVAERDRIDRAVRRDQIDDQDEVRILLLDRHAALIDDGGQRRGGLGDAVLDVDSGDAQRIADVERDGDRRGAVVGTRRGHVSHALDAVDLLFERRRHRVGDDLCAGAGIIGAHHHLRRRDVGKLRNRKQEITNRSGEHHHHGDRRSENGTLDEEIHHGQCDPQETWEALTAATACDNRVVVASERRGRNIPLA